MSQITRVPCVIMRGGTSKGVFLRKNHLPADPKERDEWILKIFGSPDQRQINGLGGGTAVTSKLAIIDAPSRKDVDIDYLFGQVSLEDKEIDYTPTCGNIATAVGLYAAEEGYVKLVEPITVVRIYNSNINKIIEVEIPVKNGEIQYEGDFEIDGVPGTASKIMVNFLDSGGAITGHLLPTGHVLDAIQIDDGRTYHVSVIDSANVVSFVSAEQLNIKGTEIGDAFNQPELLDTLEKIRVEIGHKIGLIPDKKQASPASHALPKIAVVSPPQSYISSNNKPIDQADIDIVGRYVAMGKLHQAFAVSGGIAIATGAQIPGTIIHSMVDTSKKGSINIGHPSGMITVEGQVDQKDGNYIVTRAAIGRTARRIMEGYTLV
ncbi:hypothetical protein EDD68_11015 [Melghiribacillus thermohalophilus]|uniref:Uncharacterized protein n=1 Tax=Melghiribacillus thermohalophilus TaxID=1324956 RepID=A0A4R3N0Z6_9BACI|nr:PrpF domain-containing protein [Melghiribacillus thermohalophilus]TCT21711.1 hypothetical protein EDD68_11015 [Melghiribacillus thermohalophilus]